MILTPSRAQQEKQSLNACEVFLLPKGMLKTASWGKTVNFVILWPEAVQLLDKRED